MDTPADELKQVYIFQAIVKGADQYPDRDYELECEAMNKAEAVRIFMRQLNRNVGLTGDGWSREQVEAGVREANQEEAEGYWEAERVQREDREEQMRDRL